jgi:DNA-binding transcriptional LysR family regulator
MKSEFRNWSDVRVFLAVFREGSTLAASRKLGVAQPTVARRIDELENATGLTLFERNTRGFRPTPDARHLFPLAQAIETATEAFAGESRKRARQRPIRITAPGSFSDQSMDIFSAFSALHPGTAFEFLPSLRRLSLRDGEADIALRVTDKEPDEGLICRKIGTSRWAMFGGQAYAEKHGLPKSLNDLEGHRFVTFQNDDVPDYVHKWLLRHVSPDQIIQTFSEMDLMQASIRAGHGLGLVNLRPAQFDDALIRCFGDIEDLSRPNMMLISPAAYQRPEVKAFTAFFAPRYAATFT